jgi:hypothetical protein
MGTGSSLRRGLCRRRFKAIETEDRNDDTQWLCYWCIFGSLYCAESILGMATSMCVRLLVV